MEWFEARVAQTARGRLGEPTRIAAQTLKAHVAIHKNTRIERVAFYGFQPPDYIAMAHVLAAEFPEVKAQLPPEVLKFVEEELKG